MTITIDVPFVMVVVGVVSFLFGVSFMALKKVEATRCDITIGRVARDIVEFEIEVFVDGKKYTERKYLRDDKLMKLINTVVELNAEHTKSTNDKPL